MTSKRLMAVLAVLLAGAALAGCMNDEPEEARPAEGDDGVDVDVGGGDGEDGGNETGGDARFSGNASGDAQAYS